MFEILFGIALIVFASKMGTAWSRRVGGPDASRVLKAVEDLDQRVAQNEDRIMELSAATHERLIDLEERADFAERVLQQQRDKRRIEPGG